MIGSANLEFLQSLEIFLSLVLISNDKQINVCGGFTTPFLYILCMASEKLASDGEVCKGLALESRPRAGTDFCFNERSFDNWVPIADRVHTHTGNNLLIYSTEQSPS